MSLLAAAAPAWAGVSIIDGADDRVRVSVGGRQDLYYRLAPEGKPLLVQAEGPVTLAFKLRVLRPGKTDGAVRLTRDEAAYSDNAYTLDRDPAATVEPDAAAEENAASTEHVLHVNVATGTHRFALVPVRGSTILVRVQKPPKYDPARAPAPERMLSVESKDEKAPPKEKESRIARPADAKPAEPKPEPKPAEPKPESRIARPAPREEPPSRIAPPLPVVTLATPPSPAPVVAQPALAQPVVAQPAPGPVSVVEEGSSDLPPPPRLQGAAFALRVGGLAYQGDLASIGTRGVALPFALEAAWDFGRTGSLFLEGGYYQTTVESTQTFPNDPDFSQLHTRSTIGAIPVTLGLTLWAPIGRSFGLRFRFGGSAAYVSSLTALAVGTDPLTDQQPQVAWAFGGTGGVGLEFAAGLGHVSVEGRYTALRTDLGLSKAKPNPSSNAQPGDVGGALLLAGYRLEL